MGEFFAIISKNDQPTTIRILHPQHLPYAIFDMYPHRPPEPLMLQTDSAVTYTFITMQALKEEWTIDSQVASKTLLSNIVFKNNFSKEIQTSDSKSHCIILLDN